MRNYLTDFSKECRKGVWRIAESIFLRYVFLCKMQLILHISCFVFSKEKENLRNEWKKCAWWMEGEWKVTSKKAHIHNWWGFYVKEASARPCGPMNPWQGKQIRVSEMRSWKKRKEEKRKRRPHTHAYIHAHTNKQTHTHTNTHTHADTCAPWSRWIERQC